MGKKKGKKQRNRARFARPRTEAAYFRTVPGTRQIELIIDADTGQVVPKTACEVAYTSVSYVRSNSTKPEKIVNKLYSPSGTPMLDADAAFHLFDFQVAVDTNTKTLNERRRSVVGLAIGDGVRFGTPYCFELSDVSAGMEERVGWKLAVEHLICDGFLRPDASTMLIVDAHLSEIEKINTREQPICGEFFLPPAWRMGYASADVGSEFSANRLLIAADKVATAVMNHLEAIGVPLIAGPVAPAIHGVPRKIHPKNSFSNWEELRAVVPRTRACPD